MGIILNPSARTKFFLISPELARLAGEAQQMPGMSLNMCTHHHDLSTAVLMQHEKNIGKLTSMHICFINHLLRIARTYSISSQRLSCRTRSNMTSADKVK